MQTGPIQITRISRSEFRELARADARAKTARLLPAQLDLAKLSKWVEGSVTVDSGVAVPDCQTCGACCDLDSIIPMDFAESERLGVYVEVMDDDEEALIVDRLLTHDFSTGSCAHLSGELGRHVGCGVYGKRPGVCRDFEAGSDRCMEFRRMYGFEPQLDEASRVRFAEAIKANTDGVITGSVCVIDSVSFSIGSCADEPGSYVSRRKLNAAIHVTVDGGDENGIELHSYDPAEEIWLQSQFLGMTVDEAREVIATRVREQGVSD